MKKRLMNSSRRNHLQRSNEMKTHRKYKTSNSIENNHVSGDTHEPASTSAPRDSKDYDAAKDLIDMCKTMTMKAQLCPPSNQLPMSMHNSGLTFSQPTCTYHTDTPASMNHTTTTVNPTSVQPISIATSSSSTTADYSEHCPSAFPPSAMGYRELNAYTSHETYSTSNNYHESMPTISTAPAPTPVTATGQMRSPIPSRNASSSNEKHTRITRSSKNTQKSSTTPTHTTQSLRKKNTTSTKKIAKAKAKKTKVQSKAKANIKNNVKKGKMKASEKKLSLPSAESIPTKFYGTFSLRTEYDDDVLSPIHGFIRQYGIEAFVATEEDATNLEFYGARNFKIKPGLVCTRCKYCKHLPLKDRAAKSMHYPSNMECLYYSMENWLRYHSKECEHIPADIREQMNEYIIISRSRAGGRYVSVAVKDLYWHAFILMTSNVVFSTTYVSTHFESKERILGGICHETGHGRHQRRSGSYSRPRD